MINNTKTGMCLIYNLTINTFGTRVTKLYIKKLL